MHGQESIEAPKLSQVEQACVDMLPTLVLNSAHYYCETADVSRPFPSASPPSSASIEFVWNQWLMQPFHAVGLPGACPHLLQVCNSGLAPTPSLDQAGTCNQACKVVDRSLRGLASIHVKHQHSRVQAQHEQMKCTALELQRAVSLLCSLADMPCSPHDTASCVTPGSKVRN